MKFRMMVAIASVLALFALPAAASAHKRATPQSVQSHVRIAQQALSEIQQASGSEDPRAALEVWRSRLHSKAALREALKVSRSSARRNAPRSAKVMEDVARLFDVDVEAYAGALDEASGELQAAIAEALPDVLAGREQALAKLAAIAARLPATLQRSIAATISAVSGDIDEEVATLAESVQSGSLMPDVASRITSIIGIATEAVTGVVESLSGLTELLPAAVRPVFNTVISTVMGALKSVTGIVSGLFKTGGSTVDNGDAGSAPQRFDIPFNLISQVLGLVKGLPIPFLGTR